MMVQPLNDDLCPEKLPVFSHMTFEMKDQYCSYYSPIWPMSALTIDYSEHPLVDLFYQTRPNSPDWPAPRANGTAVPALSSSTYTSSGVTQDREAKGLVSGQPFQSRSVLPAENSHFLLRDSGANFRLQGPEPVASQGERTTVSPGSPGPQLTPPDLACVEEGLIYRSFTPESALCDWKDTDLSLDADFDEIKTQHCDSYLHCCENNSYSN